MEERKLQMSHITKTFPGVKALSDVSVDFRKGEIVSLVGENGAGKSTLINVMTGQFKPDEGTMALDGKEVSFNSPNEAIEHGIGLVPQELNLIPHLSVAENIFLGIRKLKKRFPHEIDWESIYKGAEDVLNMLGIKMDVRQEVGEMSVANQQLVQIARAVSQGAELLIFDEPTACLTLNETEHLLKLIKRFREEGKTIVFVSHHLEEVMELSDRVAIMRDGCLIEVLIRNEFDTQRLINGMVGREVKQNEILRRELKTEEIMLDCLLYTSLQSVSGRSESGGRRAGQGRKRSRSYLERADYGGCGRADGKAGSGHCHEPRLYRDFRYRRREL